MSVIKFIKSTSFFKQVAIALVAVLLLVFALNVWFGYTTNHNQKIEVPDLNKMQLTEVGEKLQELNLRYEVIDSTRYYPAYKNGAAIEQNPEAGDFVKEKRKIYLTVNPSKYSSSVLPDLNGRTKRQASTQLLSLGFRIGEFSYVPDIGLDVVRVMKHRGRDLKPGSKLPRNSVIDLVLGDGNQ